MRLKPVQIRLICQKLLLTIRAKQLINLKSGEAEILKLMEEIFTKELRIEDEINAEAEKMVQQYASQMGDKIDREKMFQLIKKQLVKDKKVIL